MNKLLVIRTLKFLAIPTVYALLLRFVFGQSTWSGVFSMMTVTFLFLLPSIVGSLTIYFSSEERVRKVSFVIFAPWIPIFIFFAVALGFAIEGWPCIVMILPIFLIAASLGGMIGAYLKKRNTRNTLHITILTLLPLIAAPIESYIGANTTSYKAYTFVDINAPADVIWDNVTRVAEISATEDNGRLTNLLNFPRPVKAELNFEGVGAYREAIFTNGLVFHETVTEYVDNQKMSFEIKALPHEIPLTTMDEHLVVGGKYFDVLNGTYELQKLGENSYRLHLWSNFKLNTSFNFYAAWWANEIMKDIQNNILKIQKSRAENS
jgi:hypothetical protein